ncbi:Ribonuclease VapC2 [Frankia canadensis]|uniref:Ribonuclease VapC n=1 Tax=Frankia canadensis TaxID=1836972 RepID=A0A2I2KIS0_9ACTN|nr:PIN domain nuclease [Frankia canadensis]SNQ45568.1 Ribonuclease VapC2 [Frankia canadensis]SOU52858.1 Ribonuclease VapC2 [Frankia canadensis]
MTAAAETTRRWLIDKSALVRLSETPDTAQWLSRIQQGLIRITTVTILEVGFSARSVQDLRVRLRRPPVAAMPVENTTPRIEARAVEVQELLAGTGHHRAPSVPDLIIAATAELAGLVVLHVDKDFELIAAVTGQPAERLRLS